MSIQALKDYTTVAKYSNYIPAKRRNETWSEIVTRTKTMHEWKYGTTLDPIRDEFDWAFQKVKEKRVLGSQRALQFGGEAILRKEARIYNCLRASTRFITSTGVKSFEDYQDGEEILVLTHTGSWKKATVRNYGKQDVFKHTINRQNISYDVYATKNHRWFLKDGSTQEGLNINDKLMFGPNIFNEFDYDSANPMEKLYWIYGYVFGDGTCVKNKDGEYRHSMVRLCGSQIRYESRFLEFGFLTSSSASLKGDVVVYTGKYIKEVPDPKVDSPELIRAFVAGYLDADGTRKISATAKNKNLQNWNKFTYIQATGKKHVDFIRSCFPIAGMYIVSEKDVSEQVTNFGKRSENSWLFRIHSHFGHSAASFSTANIDPTPHNEDVWCLEVEDDHSFVFDFGLVTGNCMSGYCDRTRFFAEYFWLLLCGCGVGYSVQQHHVNNLPIAYSPNTTDRFTDQRTFQIEDSIEGWADAADALILSYLNEYVRKNPWFRTKINFDYSRIRPEGAPLSWGGKAPGPKGLEQALEKVRDILDAATAKGPRRLKPIECYDILCHLSDAVLSGGIRRAATSCLFSKDDTEMMNAKVGNWIKTNPQRARSNNSVVLLRGEVTRQQFHDIIKLVKEFGEPGFVWTDDLDILFNPCFEISMLGYLDVKNRDKSGIQACNLSEINGGLIRSEEDFLECCKAAAIIGTIQAGYTNLDYLEHTSREIIKRESLLGVSITGIMENPEFCLNPELQKKGAKLILETNKRIAKVLGINPCARATCIKPSGTASCILGTSSGIHPHHARRYIRRVQANQNEPTLKYVESINPASVEKSVWSASGTDKVISFLCEVPKSAITKNQIKAVDLLSHVLSTQKNWVEEGTDLSLCVKPWLRHNVSNTVTVEDSEWTEVADFIYDNRKHFACVSLLSVTGDRDYPQAPFTRIYSPDEIVDNYGDASIFVSGIIEHANKLFGGDLWKACDFILAGNGNGIHKPTLIQKLFRPKLQREYAAALHARQDFKHRVQKFAKKYFNGDTKKVTYLMKDVSNWKQWVDLKSVYVDIDWSAYDRAIFDPELQGIDVSTLAGETCSGGACEIGEAGLAIAAKKKESSSG